MNLGTIGVWSSQLRYGDAHAADEAAAELEELGYSTLWIPGGIGGDVLGDSAQLLAATKQAVVATGILNIWMHDPAEVAADHHGLATSYPDRFLLGLGVSHSLLIDRTDHYAKPLDKMSDYLDRLDADATPVPVGERVLAALGPRMLALARDRTAGAHPYLVTPEHTALARETLGPGSLLAPEQKVVLDTDAERARSVAREHLAIYLTLTNYTNNLRKTAGFTDEDFSHGGSDRLVDRAVVWGDVDTVAQRVREHQQAGADHVCVQVLLADRDEMPLDQWRRLRPALG